MNKVQYKMESILGDMYLVASAKGLHGIYWKKQNIPMVKDLTGRGLEIKILKSTVTEINEYLEGKRFEFEIPIELEGTDFQKKVWAELQKIPYGETRSYKDIAKLLKDENASRAVGTANGKNPISLIVPCHRVITSSGELGGYAGGLKAKNILLELEKKKNA